MLYVELKEDSKGGARRWVPLLLSLMTVLMMGLTTLHPSTPAIAVGGEERLRPLELEERETILFELERIRAQSPTAETEALRIEAQVAGLSSAASVDTQAGQSTPLVSVVSSGVHGQLVFAPAFFRADSPSQDKALSGLFHAPSVQGALVAPEIAVNPSEE